MQKIQIKNTDIKDVLIQLNKKLGGNLVENNGKFVLTLADNKSKGTITVIDFNLGIFLMDFNVCFNEETAIKFMNEAKNMIEFIFVSEGNLVFNEDTSSTYINLNRYQSIIISSEKTSKKVFIFAQKENTKTTLLYFDTAKYEKIHQKKSGFLRSKLTELFNHLNFNDKQIYVGSRNPKINEQMDAFLHIDNKDISSVIVHFEQLVHLILSNRIEQLQGNYKKTTPLTSLKESEINKITAVVEMIKKNPQEPYTIGMLCEITSLSPAKLQEGFKIVCNRTVSDFIRHVRLIEAEKLIRTSDLNISEIIYSIGFTSRSYFCKIFKKRYGSSPKQYQQKAKTKNS